MPGPSRVTNSMGGGVFGGWVGPPVFSVLTESETGCVVSPAFVTTVKMSGVRERECCVCVCVCV